MLRRNAGKAKAAIGLGSNRRVPVLSDRYLLARLTCAVGPAPRLKEANCPTPLSCFFIIDRVQVATPAGSILPNAIGRVFGLRD